MNFVNGDEAKRLVDEEGYTVLDVRDKTQFDRAHIKSCHHVPLFIENNDNDLGIGLASFLTFRRELYVEVGNYGLSSKI